MSSVILYILVGVIVLLAAIVISMNHQRISVFWGYLAILFSGAAMFCVILANDAGTLIVRADGNPGDTVDAFFSAVLSEDYDKAYSYLEGSGTLGLENKPATENGIAIWNALRESYHYELVGKAKVDGLSATQEVDFTYLNLLAVDHKVQETTEGELEKIVLERSRSEIYDSENHYLPEVTNEAYTNALTAVLAKAGDYTDTVRLTLSLDCSDNTWYLATDQTLFKALLGGVA